MTASLPIAPLGGMSVTAYLAAAVVLGFSFGFFLERAGFGSAKNLSAIFILRDFRVFRVLFSAVITGMLGIHLLGGFGVLDLHLLEIGPTFFWSMLAGGLVFGVGFYVGGFCPGTAAVALARGRWDGAFFLVGIALGIYGFALLFDGVGTEAWFTNFYAPAGAHEQTIYGDGPLWPWIVGLTVIALAAFKIVPFVEQRFALQTVEQQQAVRDGAEVPANTPPVLKGWVLKAGPVVAGVVALVIVGLDLTGPEPLEARVATHVDAVVAVDELPEPTVDSLSLASWVVLDGHRKVAKKSPNAWVLDVRAERAVTIPGAIELALEGDVDAQLAVVLVKLDEVMKAPGDRLEPVVLVDADGADETGRLVAALRLRGIDAMLLDGGFAAWDAQVLAADAVWPKPVLRPDVVAVEVDQEETPEVEEEAPEVEDGHGAAEPSDDSPPGLVDADEAAVGGHAHEAAAQPAKTEETKPAEPLTPVDMAAVHGRIRDWLAGRTDELPPRLNLPGVMLLPSRAATVVAKGGAGGGCG